MPLAIVDTVEAVRRQVAEARQGGLRIGLVPTMGALHAGHVSLIRAARAETGFVVVSIFVNPAQFGPGEDFSRYPRPLAADLQLCTAEGVDLVFHPQPSTVYPPAYHTYVEVHDLQELWEGASRPGHFRGVATVVLKLFNIVQPDIAYFGQKDGQQARIIGQMVRDLDMPLQLAVCPTVREPDGLALSSRNQYLDPEQRRQATVLYRALEGGRRLIEQGAREAEPVRQAMSALITATPGAVLDYATVVDGLSLQPLQRLSGPVLLAVAVRFGQTRLIDNLPLTVSS